MESKNLESKNFQEQAKRFQLATYVADGFFCKLNLLFDHRLRVNSGFSFIKLTQVNKYFRKFIFSF